MNRFVLAGGLTGLLLFAPPGADRPLAQDGPPEDAWLKVTLTPIIPGGGKPPAESDVGDEYAGNQDAIAAGGQLYLALNCVGCHFHGGGGMGPPLMDDQWIYGSSIAEIVSTLREGRPAGMPAYRGFVPDAQLWQVAAYVQSLSDLGGQRPGTQGDGSGGSGGGAGAGTGSGGGAASGQP